MTMSGFETAYVDNGSLTSHNHSSSASSVCSGVDEATKVVARIQKIVTPIICAFGLIGNILATTVFLSKSQRKTSCSLYLAARSITDTGFLLSLFIVCLTDLGINIFNVDGSCQIVIFLTYICGFLSVWFVVMVTVENYIRICHPFEVNRHCNVRTAKIVIVSFILIALCLYNFPLWTTGMHLNPDGSKSCARNSMFDGINEIITYLDSVITLIIPMFIIICLMIAITCSIIEYLHRQTRRKGKRESVQDRRQSSPQSKVTRLLFAVSFIFIALTLPSHVIRIQMIIKYMYVNPPKEKCPTMAELGIQKMFLILYYFSFSVNIFVYLAFGEKFRHNFMDIFLSKCLKKLKNGQQDLLLSRQGNEMRKSVCVTVQTDQCTDL